MKKEAIFRGVGTAVITPFRDGRIDYHTLERITVMQTEGGADALIFCGTTGESSTLSAYERDRLFYYSIKIVGGRVPVILGCGSNNTKVAISLTKKAAELGADGALIVSPYYNKGTEDGLCLHFERIAESADIPVILYNVPSRTGVNLSIPTLKRLARHPNVRGIKEASDSSERLIALSELAKDLPLYAGNDSQFFLTLALGGEGVISVASNAYPEKMKEIYQAFSEGRIKDSLLYQTRLLPFIRACFAETSPAPIKHAMKLLGFGDGSLRLPLTEPRDDIKAIISERIAELSEM